MRQQLARHSAENPFAQSRMSIGAAYNQIGVFIMGEPRTILAFGDFCLSRGLGDVYKRQENIYLIVSGSYGHSRLGEWVFGGVTRELLAESPICCLFSH